MTDWPAVVKAVPHDEGCAVGNVEPDRCDCTRDARIGKGIANANRAFFNASFQLLSEDECDAAAARAFTEASRAAVEAQG